MNRAIVDQCLAKWHDKSIVQLFDVFHLGCMQDSVAAEARLRTGIDKLQETEAIILKVLEDYIG